MARDAKSDVSDRRSVAGGDVERHALDTALDAALAETFPASDPVAIHVDTVDHEPHGRQPSAVQQKVPAPNADRHSR
jgi:hypothetical protein